MPALDSASRFHVYDTTLRDGAQQEGLSLSVEDKLHIARHLDDLGVGYIEGGWPGANPKDTEFFRRATDELSFRNVHARGVRRDPSRRDGRRRRPARARASRLRRRCRDTRRQEPRPARRPRAADHARGEPRDGPRHRDLPARGRPAGLPRRRALLRRLPRQPGVRRRGPPGRRGGRGRGGRPLRHQRRDAAARGGRRGGRRVRGRRHARRPGRHPLPQRHRLRCRQHPLGRRGRRDACPGDAQRLRRAHRQRRPDRRRGQPRAQARPRRAAGRQAARGDPDRTRGRRGDQRAPRVAAALRRRLGVHAQGRPARERDQGRPRPLPAHRPAGRGQRHAAARLRDGRAGVDRAEGSRARLRPDQRA